MAFESLFSPTDTIWLVAPHADDEILGCGGLLSRASNSGARICVLFITVSGYQPLSGGFDSCSSERYKEMEKVMSELGAAEFDVLFPQGENHLLLDTIPLKTIISWLETESKIALRKIGPTMVLVPAVTHTHQDHRAVSRASLSVLRTAAMFNSTIELVLEYEIPGTGVPGLGGFCPNFHVELSTEDINEKCRLFELYQSQISRGLQLRTSESIRTLGAYRGLEIGTQWAEGFKIIRSRIPLTKQEKKREAISNTLYQNHPGGLTNVEVRLDSNTKLGTFDLSSQLAKSMDLTTGDNLLDVGCGTGKHLIQFYEKFNISAHGIDPSIKETEHTGITFKRAGAETIPYQSNFFDKVMCNYAIYYIDNWQRAVEEMIRVTKKDGRIIMSGPAQDNNSQLYSFHKSIFGQISEADGISNKFLEDFLEPHLKNTGYTFSSETFSNHIVYPNLDDLLTYYTNTSLFRMTCTSVSEKEVRRLITEAFKDIYDEGNRFENIKRIRIVVLHKVA